MTSRHLPQEHYAALKTAYRLLVQRVGGGLAAASVTRVGPTQHSDYANPHKPEVFPPIDVIMDLEAVAGEEIVTAALARVAGKILLPVATQGEGEIPQTFASLVKEFSESASVYAESMSDGALTAQECERTAAEVDDILRVGFVFRALLRQRAAMLRGREAA